MSKRARHNRENKAGRAVQHQADNRGREKWHSWQGLLGIIGALVGIFGLVVAVLAYQQDSDAGETSQQERAEDKVEATQARPRILQYKASTRDKIPFEITEREGEEASEATGDAAAVDLYVENLNDQGALIDEVSILVKDVDELSTCGGGPGYATASYDFQIPIDSGVVGSVLSKNDLPFIIEGNMPERFAVSVGPDSLTESRFAAMYYLDVTLHLISGDELVAKDIVLMDPGENDQMISYLSTPGGLSPEQLEQCLDLNVETMDRFMAYPHETRTGRMENLHEQLVALKSH